MLLYGIPIDPKALLPDGALDIGSPSVLGRKPSTAELVATIGVEKLIAEAALAIGVITCMVFLAVYITKLSAAGNNPRARQSAITGILISGLSLAIFGSFGTFLAFLWGFLGS